METPRQKRRCLKYLMLAVNLCLAAAPLTGQGQVKRNTDLAVVVNPDTPTSAITLTDLRRIFRGERQYWTTNEPIVVLVQTAPLREREVVLKVVCRMTEVQYRQYWIARIFRAEVVTAPKVVNSNTVANELLAALPGTIAVVDAREVRPGLKILKIDGMLPGDAGYPLR
jgi:phosphate transport system substrate-binding protein